MSIQVCGKVSTHKDLRKDGVPKFVYNKVSQSSDKVHASKFFGNVTIHKATKNSLMYIASQGLYRR